MSLTEIGLLAISLAIDCFTVSVTSGIILHRMRCKMIPLVTDTVKQSMARLMASSPISVKLI